MEKKIINNQKKLMENSYLIDSIEEKIKNLNNAFDTEEILKKYINYITGEPLLHIENNDPMGCLV